MLLSRNPPKRYWMSEASWPQRAAKMALQALEQHGAAHLD